MAAWKRYTLAVGELVWLFGNIPAWLFMPTTTGTATLRPVSYAIYYLVFGWAVTPVALFIPQVLVEMMRDFARWVAGEARETKETQAERIARLERELGIGQSE